ncbi:MAG: hypothetical protein QM572_02155 [Nocardioides sp.]|uniref:hypothetical protein n=1 Tax=Nocardioides sp. TaxID=35761 RepID=UPI0039E343BB
MTTNTDTDLTPRVYGASELGVPSITAPGEAHPRVQYVGAELFAGLDDPSGAAVTQGTAEEWSEPFTDPKIHVRDDGITVTFAAYPKGTATLLPVTDNVVLADPSGSISVAIFEEFMDALGDRAVRTGLSPARFSIPGTPPAA